MPAAGLLTLRRRPPSVFQVPTIGAQFQPGTTSIAALRTVVLAYDPQAQVSEVRALGVAVVAWTPRPPAEGYVHYLIVEAGCWLLVNEHWVKALSAATVEAEWEPA